MTLSFLSPSRCQPGTTTSPLRRALEDVDPSVVQDLWLDGKVEIRGDISLVEPLAGEELVQLSPHRGFLFTQDDPADAVERLRAQGVLAYDATGALAGFVVEGERAMRRLTDLDLDKLPTAGPFARVSAIVLREDGERFRVYVAQELAHDVVLAVLDAAVGLTNTEVGLKPDPTRSETLTEVRLKPDPSGSGHGDGAWLQPDPGEDAA